MNRPEGQPGGPWETGHADEQAGYQRQRGEAGQSWTPGQAEGQPAGPGQAQGQPWVPGQPQGQQYDDGAGPGAPGGPWRDSPGARYPGPAAGPGRGFSPVSELDTRVTGRRVVQYIIDYVITAIVASVIIWVLDRGHGAGNAILLLVGAVVDAAWYFWYWVYRPYHANGQSFGMQLLGLRVISKDGGRASMVQLLIRGVLLIVDTLFWGLVGLITMVSSRYRQRVGDHAARTLVVTARVEPEPATREYAGAGQSGHR
jgi:uncharacterized RDD family membrane protein YckC